MPRVAADAEGPCPRCEGRGWVVADDGGAGTARPCGCREQDRVPRLLAAARIPPLYRDCTLANFNIESHKAQDRDQLFRARALCQRWVDDFLQVDGRFTERGLLLIGRPGVGKSHLAAGVLRALVERYRIHGLFVDFTTLVHDIQATFDRSAEESKADVLDPVTEAEVLVLDELGAQKPSPWVNDILYLIMNGRYMRRLPTVFTTNFRLEVPEGLAERREAPEALAARIPAQLVSRLYQMTRPVLIEAEDFRREVMIAS
jgi:DNA replication protein DnaC